MTSAHTPLVRWPEATVLLPPQYFGPVAYYARMAAYGKAVIDDTLHYDKRFKSAHRCAIAFTDGPVNLTVPVAKPHGIDHASWLHTAVSTHGHWWTLQRPALETAYGRTPFFEYYIDRFTPLFDEAWIATCPPVTELCARADAIVRSLLGLTTEVTHHTDTVADVAAALAGPVVDLRRADPAAMAEVPPYWQVRGDTLGFMPGLSILDLLFNLGPEAPLHLLAAGSASFY